MMLTLADYHQLRDELRKETVQLASELFFSSHGIIQLNYVWSKQILNYLIIHRGKLGKGATHYGTQKSGKA